MIDLSALSTRWGNVAASKPEVCETVFERNDRDIRKVNFALLPLLACGLLAAGAAGWSSGPYAAAALLLWCVMSLAVGATVGFLFGIPRSGGEAPTEGGTTAPSSPDIPLNDGGSRPNTNLEEVSDWLTKILVGLSLVNLTSIERHVHAIAVNAAAVLHAAPTATDISVATASCVGFVVMGFLCGYLYTRLFLQGAMGRANAMNRANQDYRQKVAAELAQVPAPDTKSTSTEPIVPSPADREAAARLQQAAPSVSPDVALEPIRALAAEYESIRRTMSYGVERTRRMSTIASRMQRLGYVAEPYLGALADSPSPGERLAAIMALQMRFDPARIEWLANRLVEEPAFPAYQAGSALLARLPTVGPSEAERIRKAATEAIAEHRKRGLPEEPSRDQLFARIAAWTKKG